MPDLPALVDVAVSRTAATCTLTWADGLKQPVALADLRRLCPCATCNEQREQRQGNALMVISGPLPSAELDSLEPVGGYAVRFHWADGHDTGIYSFGFLRELCEQAQRR
ncbi:MAG: DUF971 domain-containing protein [Armatimonadetes bacterium]|nr:DUF971 domain-containing protein [Armatimonadota bacterium]